MGFDLVAKNKRAGEGGDYRADIYGMYLLRCAMREAGVPEKLTQSKFLFNDGQFVTANQAAAIGTKLNDWLTGRSITVSVVEPDGFWLETIAALEDAFSDDPSGKAGKRRSRKRHKESTIVKITSQHRSFIRNFARYCLKSKGFKVY